MSEITSGTVVAVSGVIFAPVIGAAVVMGACIAAGGVALYAAGKTLTAVGSTTKQMAVDNIKAQRRINKCYRDYEKRLQQSTLDRFNMQAAQINEQQNQQTQKIREQAQLIEKLRRMRPIEGNVSDLVILNWEAFQNPKDAVFAASAIVDNQTGQERRSALPAKVRKMQELVEKFSQAKKMFDMDEQYAGLYKTDKLSELNRRLAELNINLITYLVAARGFLTLNAEEITQRNLEDIRGFERNIDKAKEDISFLHAQLAKMHEDAPQFQKARDKAIEHIEAAYDGLIDAANRIQTSSELSGLDMANEMLQRAVTAYENVDFQSATLEAKAAAVYAKRLASGVEEMRRVNLLTMLDEWRVQVVPLESIPEFQAKVKIWLQKLDNSIEGSKTNLSQAWKDADELGEVAERLKNEAFNYMLKGNAEWLMQQSKDTLEEMGYTTSITNSGANVHVIGKHNGKVLHVLLDNPTHFDITEGKSPSSKDEIFLHVKADGFGDQSCSNTVKEFHQRMHDKGVLVVAQKQFLATEQTQKLASVLRTEGFDVWIDPDPSGAVTITATGKPNSGEIKTSIDTDGKWSVENNREMEQRIRNRLLEQASSPHPDLWDYDKQTNPLITQRERLHY